MSTSIKEVLDGLRPLDKKTLEYAASCGVAQFVKLPNGKFIGVFAERVPSLVVEQSAGAWAYGSFRQS